MPRLAAPSSAPPRLVGARGSSAPLTPVERHLGRSLDVVPRIVLHEELDAARSLMTLVPPVEAAPVGVRIGVGDNVVAHHRAHCYYTATVVRFDRARREFTVAWDDGDESVIAERCEPSGLEVRRWLQDANRTENEVL